MPRFADLILLLGLLHLPLLAGSPLASNAQHPSTALTVSAKSSRAVTRANQKSASSGTESGSYGDTFMGDDSTAANSFATGSGDLMLVQTVDGYLRAFERRKSKSKSSTDLAEDSTSESMGERWKVRLSPNC